MKQKGISSKEIEVISYLELEEKRFFNKSDIRRFFKNKNEMGVYIHKLKNKKRIIRINKDKYYLIPIKAYQGYWSEYPFIVIDEIFNGKDYFIGGKAAAHYWHYIEQIPNEIDVYTTKKQGRRDIFNFTIRYRRTTKRNMRGFVIKKIKSHKFIIADKKRALEWK